MGNRILRVDSDIVILQRKEILFTTKIATGEGQIQLQLLDLIILQYFFEDESTDKIIQNVLNDDYVKYLSPSLSASVVNQQVTKFFNLQILKENKHDKTCDDLKLKYPRLKDLQNKANIDLNSNHTYKLSSNFALVPKLNGFCIWIENNKNYFKLSLEEILVAVMFLNGEACSSIKNDLSFLKINDIDKVMSLLIKNKILVKVLKKQDTKIEAEIGTINTSNHKANRLNSWEHINPDNRIPVYFVPHMENHFPLALGLLFTSIQNHNNGDLLKRFNLIPITYFTPENLLNVVYRKFGRGIWLFSNYMWSQDLNLEISRLVKAHDKGNLTIHGGPSTPNYRQASKEFMTTNNSVDISVHGEGEIAISEILECVHRDSQAYLTYAQNALVGVSGITFKMGGEFIRTSDRVRMNAPDSIPSPYLEGSFDNYYGRVDAAIIESNRGCPFGCTFCDWGSATSQKVKKYDLERTKKEIEWIGKSKTKIIWIADANFGMYERDIELSAHIVKVKEKYGYPQEVVVNYTKNTTWRLAEIIKLFTQGNIISQGIISIQTTDKMTLEVINRKNIKTSKYDELAKVFADENLPLSTDLMIGLPGITVDAFKADIQRYMDLDVAIKAYPTQLLPNSPMADPEYIAKYKIETDENNFIISSYSFSIDELAIMKKIYKYYTIADGYSVLRYVLRYLQWHYEIKSVSFLYDLMLYLEENPQSYPHLTWGLKYFDIDKCMPGGWDIFYKELKLYLINTVNVEDNSELDTVLLVNKLSMPDDMQSYPLKAKLQHDFVEYFQQFSQDEQSQIKNLSQFNEAYFEVKDPSSMAFIDLEKLQYDSHQYFWELHTPVSRASSIVS